jgi:hypothetical protein
MRGRFLIFCSFVIPFAAITAACDDDDHHRGYYSYGGENEIVFGIQQRTVAGADGGAAQKNIAAGYEFLRLSHKGGWGLSIFKDGDGEGTCYFEDFNKRLGKPHVDNGAATFGGGKLGTPGLQILANQPDETKQEGTGWSDGDILTFDVSGFAMPRIPTATMNAPREKLAVTSIAPAKADGANELSIKSTDTVDVKWTPVDDTSPFSRVMVSLETTPENDNESGTQVRCFGSAKSGSALIPAQWVARVFSSVDPAKPIKGKLEIASHRQVTIHARGSWLVYVVATTLHEEHVFNGVRP